MTWQILQKASVRAKSTSNLQQKLLGVGNFCVDHPTILLPVDMKLWSLSWRWGPQTIQKPVSPPSSRSLGCHRHPPRSCPPSMKTLWLKIPQRITNWVWSLESLGMKSLKKGIGYWWWVLKLCEGSPQLKCQTVFWLSIASIPVVTTIWSLTNFNMNRSKCLDVFRVRFVGAEWLSQTNQGRLTFTKQNKFQIKVPLLGHTWSCEGT